MNGELKMKTRNLYIAASRAVATLAKTWEVNPAWVWDLFEDECGVIKGLGNLVSQEDINRVEGIICEEIIHGRA